MAIETVQFRFIDPVVVTKQPELAYLFAYQSHTDTQIKARKVYSDWVLNWKQYCKTYQWEEKTWFSVDILFQDECTYVRAHRADKKPSKLFFNLNKGKTEQPAVQFQGEVSTLDLEI